MHPLAQQILLNGGTAEFRRKSDLSGALRLEKPLVEVLQLLRVRLTEQGDPQRLLTGIGHIAVPVRPFVGESQTAVLRDRDTRRHTVPTALGGASYDVRRIEGSASAVVDVVGEGI